MKNEKVGEMPTTIYSPYRQSKSNTTVLSIIICILGGGVGCSLFLFGGLVNIFVRLFNFNFNFNCPYTCVCGKKTALNLDPAYHVIITTMDQTIAQIINDDIDLYAVLGFQVTVLLRIFVEPIDKSLTISS